MRKTTRKRKPHKRLILLAGVFPLLLLVGCADRYETKTVNAVVIDKEYEAETTKKTTKRVNGRTKTSTKKVPAEYDVTVRYTDGSTSVETEFDDKKLYDRVKEGDTVKVTYKQGFDDDNKLVSEELELIDR